MVYLKMRKRLIVLILLILILLTGCTSPLIKKCVKTCAGDEYNDYTVRDHWETLCVLSSQYGGDKRVENQIKTCEGDNLK